MSGLGDSPDRKSLTKVHLRLAGEFDYGFLQIPYWQSDRSMVFAIVESQALTPTLLIDAALLAQTADCFFGHPCLRLHVASFPARVWTFTR